MEAIQSFTLIKDQCTIVYQAIDQILRYTPSASVIEIWVNKTLYKSRFLAIIKTLQPRVLWVINNF